ncbi:MAG: hypothetical protein WC285_02550, partial [Candidatus Gracilibacteria bacterium]
MAGRNHARHTDINPGQTTGEIQAVDAGNLVGLARETFQEEPSRDELLATVELVVEVHREDFRELSDAVNRVLDEQYGAENPDGAPEPAAPAELTPEQAWLRDFKTHFDELSALHPGIEWTDVERSLQA